MLKSVKSMWILGVLLIGLGIGYNCASGSEHQLLPIELKKVPVNGTDQVTDPEAVTALNGFSTRAASKVVEHGDSICLLKKFSGIETPHTDWADPYVRGPIKVLYIASQPYTTRNALELQQRSNFDIEILQIPASISDGDEKQAPVLHQYFEKKLFEILNKDYDVIVMPINRLFWYGGHTKNVTILKELIDAVKKQAEQGCGIVFLHNMQQWHRLDKDQQALANEISPITHGLGNITGFPERTKFISPITDSLTMAFWPETSVNNGKTDENAETLVTVDKHPILATGKCGKGRVAAFYYFVFSDCGLIPDFDQEKTPLFGDYYEPIYALYLKAIVWAANKSPRISLQVPKTTTVQSGNSVKLPLTLEKKNGAPALVSMQWQLKDFWGYIIDQGSQSISLDKQTNDIQLKLPKCYANGLYKINLWLKSGTQIENWGCTAVKVEGGIDLSVTPAQKTGKNGGIINYQIKTNSSKGKIEVRGLDDLDRLFFNKQIAAGNETSVEVDLKRSCTVKNLITFSVYDDNKNLLARKCLYLYIPKIGLDSIGEDFIIASYGSTTCEHHLSPYVGILYRQAGINTCYRNWHARRYLQELAADKNLYSISGASWGFRLKSLDKIMKNSPNIPENRAKWQKIIDQTVDDVKSYGGIGRVLDDETWYAYTKYQDGEMLGAQASQDKYTMELFQKAMNDKYKTIAELNREWDTSFNSFAEVKAVEEDDIKGKDNPAGWLEFRQYNNWTYANRYYKWVSDQHRKGIGNSTYGAGCGAPHWTTSEGGPTYKGGDISFMKSAMPFMMLYGGERGSDFPKSFVGQPGGQKYDSPLNWQQWESWYRLLNGADALWYYKGHAIIGNELAFRRQAEWMQEGVRDIRNGMGTMIRKSTPINREIRVLYSSENLAMGWLFAKRKDAHNAFMLKHGKSISENTFDSLFRNFLSFQPSYITAEDLAQGDLQDCQLLILPQIFNLSDQSAKAIKEYVKNGGCVVADILPGTRSQMGKPKEKSVLSDLFGVDGSSMQVHKEKESWYSVGIGISEGKQNWKWETIWLPADTTFIGLKATTAKIGGKMLSKEGKEAPVCFMNDFGKGKAMLLNFVYTDLNNETAGWHKLFGDALLLWANLKAPAQIVNPLTKKQLSYRPLYAFKRGQVTLLGSIRARKVWSGGRPVLIDESRTFDLCDQALFIWEDACHIYNVREGKYLGYGNSAEIDLPSYYGRLLALLPYRVTGIELDSPRQVEAGDILKLKIKIITDKDIAKDHVLRMNVYSPTGYHNLLYCKTAIAADGTATLEIPFADNDRTGDWKIAIRDVITGIEKKIILKVK